MRPESLFPRTLPTHPALPVQEGKYAALESEGWVQTLKRWLDPAHEKLCINVMEVRDLIRGQTKAKYRIRHLRSAPSDPAL